MLLHAAEQTLLVAPGFNHSSLKKEAAIAISSLSTLNFAGILDVSVEDDRC